MKSINAVELKKKLDHGENVRLLDVREVPERQEFNIGGAHIPIGQIQLFQFDDIESWKNEEVVVYCRSGKRSGMACLILEQAGFKNVTNLSGGMMSWMENIGC
jgi:rhodanese-related sulfurtransferase